MRIRHLELVNFLSYREASLDLGDLTALVGPNASGKSNAVAALKLLREIPEYGLQTALTRRGGFDQLRHRSEGRPYNPSIIVEFELDQALAGMRPSRYELHLGSVAGGLYEVKLERADIHFMNERYTFLNRKGVVRFETEGEGARLFRDPEEGLRVPDGQSALLPAASWGPFYELWTMLNGIQVVEINPARVRDLQDPTPGVKFEPDGSNTASVFESLSPATRAEVVDELAAVVHNLDTIEVRRVSTKLTLNFFQLARGRRRQFLANQMSDGTLRAFAVLLALHQRSAPELVVVEEPEVAIHLGALRTLVEILRSHTDESQILLTTHSADIIDALDVEELRVVWTDEGVSSVAPVAPHTRETVRTGLITPGELLRSDALDPLVA